MKKYLLALVGAILLASATPARAATIHYTYQTVLELLGGPDTALLDGASLTVTFDVSTTDTYVDRFGLPAAPVSNATATISGSGIAANNVAISLEPLAFYPGFAGFFTEPDGLYANLFVPSGVTLTLRAHTVPTAAGLSVVVGDSPQPAHFGPTTPDFSAFSDFDASDDSEYTLQRTSVTATETVPEPASLALLGIGALAALRSRRLTP